MPLQNRLEQELYYLIARFLESGPCEGAARLLREEIDRHRLLPPRVDWQNGRHNVSIEDMVERWPVRSDHLLRLCDNLCDVLSLAVPSTLPRAPKTLLGHGRHSVLRTRESVSSRRALRGSAELLHGRQDRRLFSVATTQCPPLVVLIADARRLTPHRNLINFVPASLYSGVTLFRRIMGHLSSVYCLLYDQTGQYIFTGADDHLVKVWSATDARLVATLRGHASEITDISLSPDNSLLASGSNDKTIRVWCLRTLRPVEVLIGNSEVMSVKFCPTVRQGRSFLSSTGRDGVCFWEYDHRKRTFQAEPRRFTDRTTKSVVQVLCQSFSPGGTLLATGCTDHLVRIYQVFKSCDSLSCRQEPERIAELHGHSDRVDSIQFAYNDLRVISGSKDGTANIWTFRANRWSPVVLRMNTVLNPCESSVPPPSNMMKVNMVAWTRDDSKVLTTLRDHSVKIWNSRTGELLAVLIGHEEEVYALECHPFDGRILITGGHDGRVIIWDMNSSKMLKTFINFFEGQGFGSMFDLKVAPDGLSFCATDSAGFLSVYGLGSNEAYQRVPDEQFFHTDYRPLIRDAAHNVLDEQTQLAPHLLPPPFLVDIDGNPYPPAMQRLVPGRENCPDDLLVPVMAGIVRDNLADGPDDEIPGVGVVNRRLNIDDMILRLQQQQDNQAAAEVVAARAEESVNDTGRPTVDPPVAGIPLQGSPGEEAASSSVGSSARPNGHSSGPATPSSSRSSSRRTAAAVAGSRLRADGAESSDGVRQPRNNWQQPNINSVTNCERQVIRPMKSSDVERELERVCLLSDSEIAEFYIERRKEQPVASDGGNSTSNQRGYGLRQKEGRYTSSTIGVGNNRSRRAAAITVNGPVSTPVHRSASSRNSRDLRQASESVSLDQLIDLPDDDEFDEIGESDSDYEDSSGRERARNRNQAAQSNHNRNNNGGAQIATSRSARQQNASSGVRNTTTPMTATTTSQRRGTRNRRSDVLNHNVAAEPNASSSSSSGGGGARSPPSQRQQETTTSGATPSYDSASDETAEDSEVDVDVEEDEESSCSSGSSVADREDSADCNIANTNGTFVPGEASGSSRKSHNDVALRRSIRRQCHEIAPSTSDYSNGSDATSHTLPPKRLRKCAESNVGNSDERVNTFGFLCEKSERLTGYGELQGPSGGHGDDEPRPSRNNHRRSGDRINRLHHTELRPTARVKLSAAGELSEKYRVPDWLTDTVPRRTPYLPQAGDIVIYFQQGHQQYAEAVRRRRLYSLRRHEFQFVWNKRLREQEKVRVVDVRFELVPPRLCCVQVECTDPVDAAAAVPFWIRYHDTSDVLDFFVLFQSFQTAMARDWKPGDRFRSIIEDRWWLGTIIQHEPFEREFPDSMFQCFIVRWDNGEEERMSPWDFEPIDHTRLPSVEGTAVELTAGERDALQYVPSSEDFNTESRDAFRSRMMAGLSSVMGLSIAEPFLVPVDLNAYPDYALVVAYPMDLSTIRARLENNFYRRKEAIKFDISYLEFNARLFNEPNSAIVRKATLLTKLLLAFVNDISCHDPIILHQRLSTESGTSNGRGNDAGNSDDSLACPGPSRKLYLNGSLYAASRSSSSSPRKIPNEAVTSATRGIVGLRRPVTRTTSDWRERCAYLMAMLNQREDSEPFQFPVDTNEFPDYIEVVETPMDLRTVSTRLSNSEYDSPEAFRRDMRLIFSNSRNYNTNKRSKIYSMTIRLSSFFESEMRAIMLEHRQMQKRIRARNSHAVVASDMSDDDDAEKHLTKPAVNTKWATRRQDAVGRNESRPLAAVINGRHSNTRNSAGYRKHGHSPVQPGCLESNMHNARGAENQRNIADSSSNGPIGCFLGSNDSTSASSKISRTRTLINEDSSRGHTTRESRDSRQSALRLTERRFCDNSRLDGRERRQVQSSASSGDMVSGSSEGGGGVGGRSTRSGRVIRPTRFSDMVSISDEEREEKQRRKKTQRRLPRQVTTENQRNRAFLAANTSQSESVDSRATGSENRRREAGQSSAGSAYDEGAYTLYSRKEQRKRRATVIATTSTEDEEEAPLSSKRQRLSQHHHQLRKQGAAERSQRRARDSVTPPADLISRELPQLEERGTRLLRTRSGRTVKLVAHSGSTSSSATSSPSATNSAPSPTSSFDEVLRPPRRRNGKSKTQKHGKLSKRTRTRRKIVCKPVSEKPIDVNSEDEDDVEYDESDYDEDNVEEVDLLEELKDIPEEDESSAVTGKTDDDEDNAISDEIATDVALRKPLSLAGRRVNRRVVKGGVTEGFSHDGRSTNDGHDSNLRSSKIKKTLPIRGGLDCHTLASTQIGSAEANTINSGANNIISPGCVDRVLRSEDATVSERRSQTLLARAHSSAASSDELPSRRPIRRSRAHPLADDDFEDIDDTGGGSEDFLVTGRVEQTTAATATTIRLQHQTSVVNGVPKKRHSSPQSDATSGSSRHSPTESADSGSGGGGAGSGSAGSRRAITVASGKISTGNHRHLSSNSVVGSATRITRTNGRTQKVDYREALSDDDEDEVEISDGSELCTPQDDDERTLTTTSSRGRIVKLKHGVSRALRDAR